MVDSAIPELSTRLKLAFDARVKLRPAVTEDKRARRPLEVCQVESTS